jgi:TolB-like protein/Tfp pilus assembly protein PilF
MPDGEDRLDSWKEIAAWLGREVRTVQLWEKSEGLPVHRLQHGRQGSVYAFKTELDTWRNARKSSPPATQPDRSRRVVWIAAAVVTILAAGLVWWRTHPAATGEPSAVAVLPFLDLSPQKDAEYFSDGLTEEIIDALSRVPNLRVVARTSSFAFKGKNTDIREIGRLLNVNAVLEGSVRKSGDRVRITAQLNRVSNGYHVWSRTYDSDLRDVFAVQREISQSIALNLRAGKPSDPARREPTRDLEADRAYQEGRFLFNKFEPPGSNLKAIERYRDAIAHDPRFVAAYAGIADAYSYLAENMVSAPHEVMPKAKEAAEKALELDDSSAEAHTSLGIVKLDYERDVEGGQREFLRAMQLNPGNGWARHWYAHSLEAQNRVEDALREMRAARDLDPLSIPINWDIAGELIILGRSEEALRVLDRAKELFPDVPVFDFVRAVANWRMGNTEAANNVIDSLRKRPELTNDPSVLSLIGAEEARKGNVAGARNTLAQFEEMRKKQYVDPFMPMLVSKALNDRERLVMWLRRADEEHSSFFVYLRPYAPYWGLNEADLADFDKARTRS